MGAIDASVPINKFELKYLFKENFNVDPPDNGLEYSDGRLTYVEVYKNRFQYHFDNYISDDLCIFGDIEIYNKNYLINKYLNNDLIFSVNAGIFLTESPVKN